MAIFLRLRALGAVALVGLLATCVAAEDPVVTVLNGTYEGLYLPHFDQDIFLGIPYAQDTGGSNRFRVPQALNTTWSGVREVKSYGDACPDISEDDMVYGMSENCLSINIIRPAGLDASAKLPVLLWIHGGSYQVGTSGLTNYNLTFIVEKSVEIGKPIIGASINYRKGGWGNMYSREIQGTGNTNLALRDMRQGLAWISENIGPFGGDTDKVTIWGESAGSFAVGQLLMTYGGCTDGLFHRSIQESGSAATAWYNGSDWYQPKYDSLVEGVNCSDAIDTLECLRTVSYEDIYPYLNSSVAGVFYPTVDGDIMPDFPTQLLSQGRFAHIPHLYGTNSDEGTANAPEGIDTDEELLDYVLNQTGWGFPEWAATEIMELYPDNPALGIPLNTGSERFASHGWQYKRAAAITGDVFYHGPRMDDARHYSSYDPTYIYRFNTRPFENSTNATYTDYVGSLNADYEGVAHFSEVAFVMNNWGDVGPWPAYEALSDQMSSQWINFVVSGNPNADGLPTWPKYSEGPNGLNLVLQVNGSYVEEDTYRLEGRNFLSKIARRRHV
ncbi:MAG: hypothetical protein M1834_005958 [Cirrosporium novae-zelandiae]|nr:MAG: hypothetical protein M1834_005958 [Cirrosporium novae-zelandiae]